MSADRVFVIIILSLVLAGALCWTASGVLELWTNRIPRREPLVPEPNPMRHDDMLDLAVERLTSLGTERGAALAMEIQRGRNRDWPEVRRPIEERRLIEEMHVGDEGWAVPWAVTVTPVGLYINAEYTILTRSFGTASMHLRRTDKGLIVTHQGDKHHPRLLGMLIPDERIIAGWPKARQA